MVTAWIFFYIKGKDGTFHLEEHTGESFTSTDPVAWGLAKNCEILLVLQHASFLAAWIEGGLTKAKA